MRCSPFSCAHSRGAHLRVQVLAASSSKRAKTGMARFKDGHCWLVEDLAMSLKLSTRPVRNRIPYVVAGVTPNVSDK